jgi:hypothetical protein
MITARIFALCRRHAVGLALGCAVLTGAPAAAQQIQTVDPDTVIDGDLANPQPAPAAAPADSAQADPVTDDPAQPGFSGTADPASASPSATGELPASGEGGPILANSAAPGNEATTYSEEELLPAAEGVFGKGAQGLAQMIEDLLKKQGRPNGYIVGVEGGGAFIVGVRYGSGTLYHKIEGQREVHWTGPSLGADFGASGGRTFILVYNLYDTDDLYHRYMAGEGQAYLFGGFNISELKRDDVVLIPVRLGVGLRLGLNVGYMKFSEHKNLLPF